MSEVLTLRFTKLSDERHRFEYRRPDGTGEAIEMETRSLLRHDLLHFALEREAGLRGSFSASSPRSAAMRSSVSPAARRSGAR